MIYPRRTLNPATDDTGRAVALAGLKPPEWTESALCAQVGMPDLWWPSAGGSVRPAVTICHRCPVETICGAYAIENNIFGGVWGGMSENERFQLRRPDNARRRAKALTDADWDNAVTAYVEGEGLSPLAERLRVGRDLLRTHLTDAGVPIRNRTEALALRHREAS